MDGLTAIQVVKTLGLAPLPGEGGMFRNTIDDGSSTAIYFLVERDRPTMLHRLPGSETFHFYMGSPARLVMLLPEGEVERPVLGTDLLADERPQLTVPGGRWQALETLGDWTLVGTTMAPGYHEEDFELAEREELLRGWPGAAELVRRHTPPAASILEA
jgi:predicted cupin superfamily sugar epimerase